ncbi:hypothetical protein UA70_18595, partial [Raoultella planticola]
CAADLRRRTLRADRSGAPDLFARCSIALLICAAVLCVLIVPVRRMLENTQNKPHKTGYPRLTATETDSR